MSMLVEHLQSCRPINIPGGFECSSPGDLGGVHLSIEDASESGRTWAGHVVY